MTTKKTRAAPLHGQRPLRYRAAWAPVCEFPKQPSRKDGLGTMCTEHWRAYVTGLRDARKAAQADAAAAAGAPEADAAERPSVPYAHLAGRVESRSRSVDPRPRRPWCGWTCHAIGSRLALGRAAPEPNMRTATSTAVVMGIEG
jgi:hypothetical protein